MFDVVLKHHITVDDLDEETKKKIEDIGISEEQYVKMINRVVDIVAVEEEDE